MRPNRWTWLWWPKHKRTSKLKEKEWYTQRKRCRDRKERVIETHSSYYYTCMFSTVMFSFFLFLFFFSFSFFCLFSGVYSTLKCLITCTLSLSLSHSLSLSVSLCVCVCVCVCVSYLDLSELRYIFVFCNGPSSLDLPLQFFYQKNIFEHPESKGKISHLALP